MSSYKKAMKSGRRDYKERHQPEERKQFGHLEKKQDYKLRSNAYHVKENKLRKLNRKAKNKNPDEFCFHMINSEMKDGFHFEKEKEEEHTEAQAKLMQTRDSNYINLKLSSERKKVEELQLTLALRNAPGRSKNIHTFYVDSKAKVKKFNAAKHLKTHPALLNMPSNRLTLDQLKTLNLESIYNPTTIQSMSKETTQKFNELNKRIDRVKELTVIRDKLDMQKKLSNKREPEAKLIKAGTKTSAPIYLWKQERKR